MNSTYVTTSTAVIWILHFSFQYEDDSSLRSGRSPHNVLNISSFENNGINT
jgi:hypothetical protein